MLGDGDDERVSLPQASSEPSVAPAAVSLPDATGDRPLLCAIAIARELRKRIRTPQASKVGQV